MLTIYLSYRKTDNPLLTQRIYDALAHHFGENSIVKDMFHARDILKSSPTNSLAEMQWAINRSDVMLVIIGRHWLADAQGKPYLADVNDPVLQELGFAFTRPDLPIIPVLIDNAQAPTEAQLGPALRMLAFKNHAVVRDGSDFERDMMHLIEQINKVASGQISGVRRLTENDPPLDDERELDAHIIQRRKLITMLGLTVGGVIGLLIVAFLLLQSIPK